MSTTSINKSRLPNNNSNKISMLLLFIVAYVILGIIYLYLIKFLDQQFFRYNPKDREADDIMVLYLKILIEIVIIVVIFALYLFIMKQIGKSLKVNNYYSGVTTFIVIIFIILCIVFFQPFIFKSGFTDNTYSEEDQISNLNLGIRVSLVIKNLRELPLKQPKVIENPKLIDPNYNMKSWKAINNREYIFDKDTKNHLDSMLHQNKIRNNAKKQAETIEIDIPFHKKFHLYRDSKSRDNRYSFRNSYPNHMFPPKEDIYFQDSELNN